MNARQAAKKWKQKYEQLANTPMPRCKIETHKIDTLHFERYYSVSQIFEGAGWVRNALKRDIGDQIASHLDDYAVYFTEFVPHRNEYKLSINVRVVKPDAL